MPIHSLGFKYEPMVGTTHSGSTGELWLDLDTGILRLGNNSVPGGSTVVATQPNGVNDMGGGLWVGNIRDNDSVLWAGPDSEYAGIWWSGNRAIDEPGYGPYAAIHVGAETPDDMDNEYPPDTQINLAIGSDYTWTFGSDGNLKIPGDITSVTDTSISVGGSLLQNIVVRTVDELVPPGNVWRLFILDSAYPTLGANISIGETVTTAWGTPVTATITAIQQLDGDWQIQVDQDITAGFAAGPKTVTFGAESKTWTFGTDGSTAFPNYTFPSAHGTAGQVLVDDGAGNLSWAARISVNDFGDGFYLDNNSKVVTRKLYSTNPGDTSIHYRLELTTGGTIKLPDSSEIIGSTLKGTYGTGELNYTGLTIGPSSGNSENTWMYVDAYDAYIATDYANNAYTWKFDRNGNLTVPGEIRSAAGTGIVSIQSNDGSNTYTWNFGTDGTLTLPKGGGSGADDEGAEIDFTKAVNSTLSGNSVVVDQYINRLRFFESGGTTRGAYIDLTQAAAGVGTLLNNRVSAFVNAGTFVIMDNIKATVTTSGQRGLSLATVLGTATCFISGTYGMFGGDTVGGASAGVALTTTPSVSIFSWDFSSEGDTATYILNDGYTKSYRITMMIGGSYANNMISIERLI